MVYLFGGDIMRLDKYLKVSRIIKRRSVSKELIEANRVKVNGTVAKPGFQLNIADQIEINLGKKRLTVKVKELKEHVLKDDVDMLYEIIKEETIEGEIH